MSKEQVTLHNSNNQLLYFTSSSILKNNSGIVFISDRTGHPNLFHLDFDTSIEHQLTYQSEGYLRSYVYFDGRPYNGFGKASISLDSERGIIYYLQGNKVMKVWLDGTQQELCRLADGQMTGFTHVSTDGKFLCVPTIDAAAFEVEQPYSINIDKKVHEKGLISYLRVFDTQTGEQVLSEPVQGGWVTHVQFCPTDSRKILYNHEWCENSGIRRMWLFDGVKHIKLRTENEQRKKDDWTCHEMWGKDGIHVIYHGGYANGSSYIGRVNISDLSCVEIETDPNYKAYGHFTVMDTGTLVSDGYYAKPNETNEYWGGKWISLQKIDWEKGEIQWEPLCHHGSNWDCQCSHPHPILAHGDNYAYFTSNETSKRQIYRIATGI